MPHKEGKKIKVQVTCISCGEEYVKVVPVSDKIFRIVCWCRNCRREANKFVRESDAKEKAKKKTKSRQTPNRT